MYLSERAGGPGGGEEQECESCGKKLSFIEARRLGFRCDNPLHADTQMPHTLHDSRTIHQMWLW